MQHGTDNPTNAMPTTQQIANAKTEFEHQQRVSFHDYSTPLITLSHPKYGDVKVNASDKHAESHWLGQGFERAKGK